MAQKILFTSGKGGVGKSTLSTTFAKVLCSQGKTVLMIDFDVSLRTLDIMLSLSDSVLYDWYDVIKENCEPGAAPVKGKGPALLPAPLGEVEVSKEDVKRLIDLYDDEYDYIILDSPAGVGPVFELALGVVDLAMVVSTPDLVCVRSAAVAADKISDCGVNARLIINRFKKSIVTNGQALNIDEVIDATGVQLIGVVPEDINLSLALLNGELIDPGIKSVRAVKRIIRRINGEKVPLRI